MAGLWCLTDGPGESLAGPETGTRSRLLARIFELRLFGPAEVFHHAGVGDLIIMTPSEFCEPVKKLFIGMAVNRGGPKPQAAVALTLARGVLGQMGIPFCCDLIPGDAYVDRVMNTLVTDFLGTDCTDILLWDDDVGCETMAVEAICRARRPFVAGVYPKRQDEIEWPVEFPEEPAFVTEEGLLELPVVPTGFTRLNRAIFEVMPHDDYYWPQYPTPRFPDAPRLQYGYFKTKILDMGYHGQDKLFCEEWRRLGGKIWVIPNLNFSHTGDKTWTGNLYQWLVDQAGQLPASADTVISGSRAA